MCIIIIIFVLSVKYILEILQNNLKLIKIHIILL